MHAHELSLHPPGAAGKARSPRSVPLPDLNDHHDELQSDSYNVSTLIVHEHAFQIPVILDVFRLVTAELSFCPNLGTIEDDHSSSQSVFLPGIEPYQIAGMKYIRACPPPNLCCLPDPPEFPLESPAFERAAVHPLLAPLIPF